MGDIQTKKDFKVSFNQEEIGESNKDVKHLQNFRGSLCRTVDRYLLEIISKMVIENATCGLILMRCVVNHSLITDVAYYFLTL